MAVTVAKEVQMTLYHHVEGCWRAAMPTHCVLDLSLMYRSKVFEFWPRLSELGVKLEEMTSSGQLDPWL